MYRQFRFEKQRTLIGLFALLCHVWSTPAVADNLSDQSDASSAILTTESNIVPGLTSIFIGTASATDSVPSSIVGSPSEVSTSETSTASSISGDTSSDLTPGLTSVPISTTTGTDSQTTDTRSPSSSSEGAASSFLTDISLAPGLSSIPISTTTGTDSQTTDTRLPSSNSEGAASSFSTDISLAPGLSSILITTAASSGAGPLTTFSALPQSISTTVTSVTTNTHDGSGHPILGPFPLCWFCPKDSTGIILLDLPPGIYPGGGPPIDWPISFPPLTIDLDGSPHYPETSTTSSPSTEKASSNSPTGTSTEFSTSCTDTATVTDVTVYVTIISDATTTTSSTVSSDLVTRSGCGIKASTITSTASAQCSTCCPDWSVTMDDCNAEDDADREDCDTEPESGLRVRGLAGRITLPLPDRSLNKRTGTRTFSTFGACTMQTRITNLYPNIPDYSTLAGPSSFYLATYVSQPNNPSCLPIITSVSTLQGVSTASGGLTYTTGSGNPQVTPIANSDHVYEIQILNRFLDAQLAGLSPAACLDFQNFFENQNTQHLQNIWNYMPSNGHPDMAGMDQLANGDKGLFYLNRGNLAFPANTNNKMRRYAKYGLAAQILQQPDIIALFQRTHQRMYQAFLGIDASIAASNPAGQQATWACAYTDFVGSYLDDIAVTASSVASVALSQIASAGSDTSGLSATFPPNMFAIPVAQMTALNPGLLATNVKRQACPAPITSATGPDSSTNAATPGSSPDTTAATATSSALSASTPTTDTAASTSPPPFPTLSNTGTSFAVATATSTYITCIGSIGSCIVATLTDTYLSPGTPSFVTPSPSSAPTFTGSSGPEEDTLTEVTLTKRRIV